MSVPRISPEQYFASNNQNYNTYSSLPFSPPSNSSIVYDYKSNPLVLLVALGIVGIISLSIVAIVTHKE